jgi:homoserine kinase
LLPVPNVRVFAPATVSNVGPGFDVMGFALPRPGDTVDVSPSDTDGVTMLEVTGDGGVLPRTAAANAAGAAADSVLQAARALARSSGLPPGIRLSLHKGLPLQSGLGSSGASAAAGAVAANELLGRPFAAAQLVEHAMAGERASCGSAHADNVAPAILGGLVLVRSYTPLEILSLPVPDGLFVAVVHPHCRVSTRQARALLDGRTFPLSAVVANMGNVAAMVAALYQGNLPLIGRCLEDRIVEPIRAALIPGYETVRSSALKAGALGCCISGSGPTLFALADSESTAARVASAMRAAFREAAHLASEVWTGPISTQGARVVA